jgi:hypothetical protein
MELSDEAKAEIQAAARILRDDGVHVHKTYKRFLASQETPPADPKTPPADPKTPPADPKTPPAGSPAPPPAKDPVVSPVEPGKKGDWWWGTKE